MLKHTRATILSFLVAASVLLDGTLAATAGSGLPGAAKAGFGLDCGHSLANDESVWTPGENVGRSIAFVATQKIELVLEHAEQGSVPTTEAA